MAQKTDYFWTDVEQAQQRLLNTVVLYDDNPALIQDIRPSTDGVPRASLLIVGESTAQQKKLNSPHFKKFRELPKLGWMNVSGVRGSRGAVFLARRALNTRIHGLQDSNMYVYSFSPEEDHYTLDNGQMRFSHVYQQPGFKALHLGQFPSLAGVLANIKEGTAIAYSRMYACYRDSLGCRWLYRGCERVGLFTGTDTLNLFTKFSFYREEIMEDPAFTLNNIQEF